MAREDAHHEIPEAFLGIGIRIEDDVVITDSGHDNLTSTVPTGLGRSRDALAEGSMLPDFLDGGRDGVPEDREEVEGGPSDHQHVKELVIGEGPREQLRRSLR